MIRIKPPPKRLSKEEKLRAYAMCRGTYDGYTYTIKQCADHFRMLPITLCNNVPGINPKKTQPNKPPGRPAGKPAPLSLGPQVENLGRPANGTIWKAGQTAVHNHRFAIVKQIIGGKNAVIEYDDLQTKHVPLKELLLPDVPADLPDPAQDRAKMQVGSEELLREAS